MSDEPGGSKAASSHLIEAATVETVNTVDVTKALESWKSYAVRGWLETNIYGTGAAMRIGWTIRVGWARTSDAIIS